MLSLILTKSGLGEVWKNALQLLDHTAILGDILLAHPIYIGLNERANFACFMRLYVRILTVTYYKSYRQRRVRQYGSLPGLLSGKLLRQSTPIIISVDEVELIFCDPYSRLGIISTLLPLVMPIIVLTSTIIGSAVDVTALYATRP